VQALSNAPGVSRVRASRLYRSAPVEANGPDFINAVVELQTTLSAPALLDALQAIENAAGRQRPYPNAPRTLDLDLLLYGCASVSSPRLRVPHPRMGQRAFVLQPLAELAPERVTAEQLRAVADQSIEPLAD
jgi:2-amino-4-hydroxy-6-hydroxymethyldihydropteridine diphosphokinase